ncbi:ABC transporter permease [Occallatibacter riparius]|uniref:ABC transporter permease n=1 Tax=Occallatibacter riparius TaxID=1002689 RepID=A0A9J7BTC9_9BACT|nr:ABC transporter permease [Occallatibacter riparius]UWZ85904.1 ABC transporter permease [Occallatibacter riparius]
MRRITNLFRRERLDGEIAEELRAHIDLRIEDNLARGMTPEDARREALVRFGNTASTRERVMGEDAALSVDSWWADMRYALRKLANSPGFTITAIFTLAVGIGVNTAIFSSMDAVVLRPLAVPAMDRVVTAVEQDNSGNQRVALADYEDWARDSRAFEELSVRTEKSVNLTGAGDAAQIEASLATANFFSALRVEPVLGRLYVESEAQPGRDAVAVLNYGFWTRRFASDPAVLGRRIELDGRGYTVIGVLPKSVQYPSTADVFLPLAPTPQQLQDRKNHNYFVMGRLRDGVTVRQAQAEMRTIADRIARAYPATNNGMTAHVEPLLDGINDEYTPMYYRLIMGATLFVLLVVCANIANLQIARGIDRRPEIAMRRALGASRWRIIQQLLIENLLLGLAGAAGGVVIGQIDLKVMNAFMPERVARYMAGWTNIHFSARTFFFSVGLAVLAGVMSGMAPALEAIRVNPAQEIRAGSRSAIGSKRNRRLRSVFAVAQISLAVALVIGAALISKGMRSMLHSADEYEPNRVLTFDVALPAARYGTPRLRAAYYAQALERLRGLPGVKWAEVTNTLPYSDYGWVRDVEIENRPTMPGKFQTGLYLPVSEGYFAALRIGVLQGRGFTPHDTLDTVPVAVVSQRFVAQYFPNQSPLGHRIRLDGQNSTEPWLTIVGVVQETSYSLWDSTPHAVVYLNTSQAAPAGTEFAIFAEGHDALPLAPAVRQTLSSVDPALPLNGVQSYWQYMHERLTGLMYASAMLGIDGLIALLLAAIGIFGAMANLVGERTREIGVRLALGASREDVLRMILRRASWLAGSGLGLGLVLAFWLAKVLANLLRGVSPHDAVVFTSITVVIAAVALVASWLPARRAAKVDPMEALRSE